MKINILCLLALTVLPVQPALANEPQNASAAADQHTVVLGQPEPGTPPPAPEEKTKKGAQALFEESLRQTKPHSVEYRPNMYKIY